ncbi:MAG: hypothetical protein U0893_11155 [Chloroflexota bacterium]
MFARLARPIVVVLMVSVLASPLVTPAARAQTPFPPRLAESIAACMTSEMAGALTGPAWVEQLRAPQPGWRVVLPLQGQPTARREQMQSPPPATNTLAWIDLHRFGSVSMVPNDIDNFTSYVMVTSTGEVYAVYTGGYFWLRVRGSSQTCFERSVDSRMWPVP